MFRSIDKDFKEMEEKEADKLRTLYAFWKYDQFPYRIGAAIQSVDDAGCTINPKGYSRNDKFRARYVLSRTGGEKVAKQLNQLVAERQAALEAIEAKFAKRLEEEFPNLFDGEQVPRKKSWL